MITVMLADDHSIVRTGLRSLIEDCEDMVVAAEATDGNMTVEKALETKPDVLVLDISMPGLDGLEVVSQLKALIPRINIIILSMHEEEHCVIEALELGAKGYVTKRSAPDDLIRAIRKIHAGGHFLSQKASEILAYRVSLDPVALDPIASLSSREKQVLHGLATGKTIGELSTMLGLSDKTISTYRSRLLKKLGLKNNVELALFAVRNRIINI
ncbi:MAG: response regulator transcription factor [Desulfobacterales bacterium]|nr:response regulator transcription factor [Desulfobacterales bacterium]